MITPSITAKGNGWFEFAINDSDSTGCSVEFSKSFQTRSQAEAFAASLGFGDYVAVEGAFSSDIHDADFDHEIAAMMRENRSNL